MVKAALIGIPLLVGAAALGLAALVLPACAIGVFAFADSCPPVADPAPRARIEAAASRRAALEAEIAALQRRVAALPQCPAPVAALPEPAPPPAAPPRDIPEERWNERDISLLDGCWRLDSDLRFTDVNTRQVSRVRSWRMCFDEAGNGRQTIVMANGTRCEAPVRGRFTDSGALRISDLSDVRCADRAQTTIFRRVATCTLNRNGRADCVSRQPDRGRGATPFTLRR